MKIFVGGLLEKQGCWPDPRPLRGDRDGWDSPGLHPGILPRLLRGPRWEAEKAQTEGRPPARFVQACVPGARLC